MNLPKLEACGNFVREARTSENLAGFAVAEIPLYAQSNASGIATEISRRCNEYDELKKLRDEVIAARKEWIGDDLGHLSLMESLAWFREKSHFDKMQDAELERDASLLQVNQLKERVAELESELSAKSRDTDRINWLDLQFGDDSDWQRVFYGATSNYSLRDSIDAARKNGGAA